MPTIEGSVEQQDSKGWTPVMWSSSNGYSKLVKQLVQRGANVHHMGQARGGSGTTMALHECAAMRGESQSPEAFYETAWLLMAAGASPFTERSDGKIPIEVAADHGNLKMKTFLEGCALFRGTLAMPVPQTFGSKVKNRYCTVQPRFPFGNAAPTLWMLCYKSPQEPAPTCKIPLENARVVIEGMQDSNNGFMIIPGSGKSLKGVAIKSHTSNSYIVEIRAVGTPSMPGWKTLRTLADVCKAAAVAASCRNLDQLCAAALRQATRQMRIPGTNAIPDSDDTPPPASSEGKQTAQTMSTAGAVKGLMQQGEGPGPIADSAEDMTPPSAAASQAPEEPETEPDTPRSSRASEVPRRSSMGLGKLFKSTFRRSSVSNKMRYNSQNLDSSSSLGHISNASTTEPKKSLWGGLKKSMSLKPNMSSMPSITEQGTGLTAADIDALSQPIPDKFWSKIGRKMSSQRPGWLPPQGGRPAETWFHDHEGAAPGVALPPAAKPRRSFTSEDLDDLMYPAGRTEQAASVVGNGFGGGPANAGNAGRQPADAVKARAMQNGTVPFVLEEPIVPTQEMVPTGPRRSFSFDDLDDMVTGASRKARGHREAFVDQMAPPPALLATPSRGMPPQQQRDPSMLQSNSSLPSAGAGRYPPRPGSREAVTPRSRQAFANQEEPSRAMRNMGMPLPRRSFSFHDLDQLLQTGPLQEQQQRQKARMQNQKTVQDDLQAWRLSQGQPGTPKKKGPLIDPFSYGGYQGAPAPEWRPYRAPTARTSSNAQSQVQSQPIHQHQMPPSPRPRQQLLPDGRVVQQQEMHPHSSRSLQSAASSGMQVPQDLRQHSSRSLQSAASSGLQMQTPGQPLQFMPARPPAVLPEGHAVRPQSAFTQASQVPRQSRSGESAASRQGRSTDEVIPPELAHLASLRALETENLSTTSGKAGDDKGGSSGNNTHSQDIADLYTSAQGPDTWAHTGTKPHATTTPPPAPQQQPHLQQLPPLSILSHNVPAKTQGSAGGLPKAPEAAGASLAPTPPELSPRPPIAQVSPAVPAVLFQGTKMPKIMTPPQRIAKERIEEVPEYPPNISQA